MALDTAVVGAGEVSSVHLSGIERNPRTTLAAVCDLDEERVRRAAQKYGCGWYTDVDELLDEEDIDWLHVCTPVQTHLEVALTAISAGVPVLVEKPVTQTVDELDEMIEAADRQGVRVGVVHNQLYLPAVRAARERIAGGELGSILGVDLVYSGMTRPDEPKRGSWTFALDGGEFEEGLPHSIYVTLDLGGVPASAGDLTATTALRGNYEQDFTYDTASFQYVTDTETICSGTMRPDPIPQRSITVHGERASLVIDSLSHTVVTLDRDYGASATTRALKTVDHSVDMFRGTADNFVRFAKSSVGSSWADMTSMNSHFALFENEVDAIERGNLDRTGLERARWTLTIMESIRESPRTLATPP